MLVCGLVLRVTVSAGCVMCFLQELLLQSTLENCDSMLEEIDAEQAEIALEQS